MFDVMHQLGLGFLQLATPANALSPVRRPGRRDARGSAARPHAGDGRRARPAVHLRHGRHAVDHPAHGDVPVRDLRRGIHVDPVPHSGRAPRRPAAVGRLSDGAPGPAGPGARLDAAGRAVGRADHRGFGRGSRGTVRQVRAALRRARILRNRHIRPDRRRGAGRGVDGQGPDQPLHRPVARDGRRRRYLRRRPVHLPRPDPQGWHRVPDGDGRCLRSG